MQVLPKIQAQVEMLTDRKEQRNRSGGCEASDKNQNFEEEQNESLDLDTGNIARALENQQQIDDSSSSGIEDITAEVVAERGVFGHFLIANSQNEMMERDVEEATENRTMTDGKNESQNILSPD